MTTAVQKRYFVFECIFDEMTYDLLWKVIEFVEKARIGEPLPNESVIRMARLFKDELTLANIARPQLVSM